MSLMNRRLLLLLLAVGLLFARKARAEDASSITAPLPSAPTAIGEPEAPPVVPSIVPSAAVPLPTFTPTPSAPSSEDEEYVPEFHRVKPQWAVHLGASLSAYPDKLMPPHLRNSESLYGAQLVFNFQPEFLQGAGVFGIGPVGEFTTYPGSLSNTGGQFGIGGEVRYQAAFARQQWIVPYAALQWMEVFYDFKQGPRGVLGTFGPLYGVSLLLNGFSQKEAGEFYANWSVARSYLFAELHTAKGEDRGITLQGRSVFFGLRLEW